MKNKRYGIILSTLLILFCFRVTAQLIQYYNNPIKFLPAFTEWQSGGNTDETDQLKPKQTDQLFCWRRI